MFQGTGSGAPPVWTETPTVKKINVSFATPQTDALVLTQSTSATENKIVFNTGSSNSTVGLSTAGNLKMFSDSEIDLDSANISMPQFGVVGGGYLKIDSAGGLSVSAGSGGTVGTADNIAGGAANKLVIQTGIDSTGFLNLGTNNQALIGVTGSQPVFTNLSDLTVGEASNIKGGLANYIPFQEGTDVTGFIEPVVMSGPEITAGTCYVLAQKNNTDPASYHKDLVLGEVTTGALTTADVTCASLTDASLLGGAGFIKASALGTISKGTILDTDYGGTGNNLGAASILGGTKYQIPYQFDSNITSFTGPGLAGQVLTGRGALLPPAFSSSLSGLTSITAANLIGTVAMSAPSVTADVSLTALSATVTGLVTAGSYTSLGPLVCGDVTCGVIGCGVVTSAGVIIPAGGITVTLGEISAFSIRATSALRDASQSNWPLVRISSDGRFIGTVPADVANVEADKLRGGDAGKIPYQTGVGATSFTAAGTTGQILKSNGTGAPTWIDTSAITAGLASKLAGGSAGLIPYQSSASNTSFVPVGLAGQILSSNGAAAPTWIYPSGVSVSSATNISGGSAYQILIQTGVGATGFVNAGSGGQILVGQTSNVPTWLASPTRSDQILQGNFSSNPIWTNTPTVKRLAILNNFDDAPYVNSITVAHGGTGSAIVVAPQTNVPSISTFAPIGQQIGIEVNQNQLGQNNFIAFKLRNGVKQTNIGLTATTGVFKIETDQDIEFRPGNVSLNGTVSLISQNTVIWSPVIQLLDSTFTNAAYLSVDSSNNLIPNSSFPSIPATSLLGGSAGLIPYQSALDTTLFIPAGTSGQLLKSNGTSSPSWINPSSLTIGSATNLSSGGANQLVYQSSTGNTAYITAGVTKQILQATTGSAPSWTNSPQIAMLNVNNATVSGPAATITTNSNYGLRLVSTSIDDAVYITSTRSCALTTQIYSGYSTNHTLRQTSLSDGNYIGFDQAGSNTAFVGQAASTGVLEIQNVTDVSVTSPTVISLSAPTTQLDDTNYHNAAYLATDSNGNIVKKARNTPKITYYDGPGGSVFSPLVHNLTTGIRAIEVWICGGGGGGGASSAISTGTGGGGAQTGYYYNENVTTWTTLNFFLGPKGIGGTGTGNGTAGGASQWANGPVNVATVTVPGGTGGNYASNSGGSPGFGGSGATFYYDGGWGTNAGAACGGSSYFTGGQRFGGFKGSGGGAGTNSSPNNGYDGGDAFMMIKEYF